MHGGRLHPKEPPDDIFKSFPLEKALPDQEVWSVHLFEFRIGFGDEVTLTPNHHRGLHGAFVRTRDEVRGLHTLQQLRYSRDLKLPQLIEGDIRVLVTARHIPIRLPVPYKINIHRLFRKVRVVVKHYYTPLPFTIPQHRDTGIAVLKCLNSVEPLATRHV